MMSVRRVSVDAIETHGETYGRWSAHMLKRMRGVVYSTSGLTHGEDICTDTAGRTHGGVSTRYVGV